MKRLYAPFIIALALSVQQAWAPAYDSDSDFDADIIDVEFKKFEIGDKISMERFNLDTEEKKVFFDGKWYKVETRVLTQWPQQLMQFRQEGDYYRLYTRPRMTRGFVKQSGLWKRKSDHALFMPRYYCHRIS